jgi:hypothetical protein
VPKSLNLAGASLPVFMISATSSAVASTQNSSIFVISILLINLNYFIPHRLRLATYAEKVNATTNTKTANTKNHSKSSSIIYLRYAATIKLNLG